MISILRKISIWLLSVLILASLFWVYLTYVQKVSPSITQNTDNDSNLIEPNDVPFEEKVGRISGVGVESLDVVTYTHLNENKQIDRELGFEKLLHEIGNNWELKKPFMNLYRDSYTLSLTADIGKVQVDTEIDKPTPKDATLTGNVVINVKPRDSDDFSEINLYLDDIIYESEKSKFRSSGPVRAVSKELDLKGKGFELVFNPNKQRLEYLKIDRLNKLILKNYNPRPALNQKKQAPKKSSTSSPPDSSEDKKVQKKTDKNSNSSKYQCKITKNVQINTPQQFIYANDLLFVNSIVFTSDRKEEKETAKEPADPNENKKNLLSEKKPKQKKPQPKMQATEKDIVVTCKGSILIRPQEELEVTPEFSEVQMRPLSSFDDSSYITSVKEKEAVFESQKIRFDYDTQDILAEGKNRLRIFTQNLENRRDDFSSIKITSDKKVVYDPNTNRVTFNKDAECHIVSDKKRFDQNYILRSPDLQIDFDNAENKIQRQQGIKRITTLGGKATLAGTKSRNDKIISGIQLKCKKFDYDQKKELVLAAGPGNIVIDNSNAPSDPNASKFDFKGPYWAVIRNFEFLKYKIDKNNLTAESASDSIMIDYVPVRKGKRKDTISIALGNIDADFAETATGKTQLQVLNAEKGVFYQDKDLEFAGSELFYNTENSILDVKGNDSHPCILNGQLVESIKYDMKNEKLIKAEIKKPGVIN